MKDISAAIQTARDEPSRENLEALWQHVMRLPAWYLLPAQSEGESLPLVAELADGPYVVAFTHLRTLNAFAVDAGMRTESGDLPMLPLAPAEAVARIVEAGDHIDGAVFNPASDLVFRAPTQALAAFAERFIEIGK